MTRIPPLDRHTATARDPGIAAALRSLERTMGFVPEDCLVLARHPPLFHAVNKLVAAVYGSGTVALGFKKLVGHVASRAAGCRYCTAHTAHGAARSGVEAARLDAVWEFEASPLFDEAERAALRMARGAALTPNAVSDDDLRALRQHYSDEQVVELVGVVALFGFLNRWNATLDTTLEPAPAAFVGQGQA